MTVEESATDGSRSTPRTIRAASLHMSFARRGLGDGENGGSWLKRVFVEQDGKIVAVSAGVELARDVRSVIAGFLEDHHVEAAAGGTEGLRGPPASWAYVSTGARRGDTVCA